MKGTLYYDPADTEWSPGPTTAQLRGLTVQVDCRPDPRLAGRAALVVLDGIANADGA